METTADRSLEVLPRGICSWDFQIRGAGLQAYTEKQVWGESGAIIMNGRRLQIDKSGYFSGKWKLMDGGHNVATAGKTSAFTRTFRIETERGHYELIANSAFTREMHLRGDRCSCVISPGHAFTRRATIMGVWQDDLIVVFAFWLTALTWRRSSNNGTTAST